MAKFYDYRQKQGETLQQQYKRLAKVADQRLVRLEAAAQSKEYSNIKQWAYARAMYDIKSFSGKDAKRFNQKMPESEEELRAQINSMKAFLGSPSSTVSGLSKYKHEAKVINQKYGTNFSWQDMVKYFSSKMNEKFDKINHASDVILRAIGRIQRSEEFYDMTYEDMKKMAWNETKAQGSKGDYRIDPDDPIMDDVIKKLLRSHAPLKEYI